MLKYYETFEVKLDPIKFAGRTRGVDVDNSESQKASGCEFPLKSGWGFYEVDSWHGKEDYQEVRIYPDETCIKKWKYESDLSEGTYEGKLLKPYEESLEKVLKMWSNCGQIWGIQKTRLCKMFEINNLQSLVVPRAGTLTFRRK
jgi:hypothetical protein